MRSGHWTIHILANRALPVMQAPSALPQLDGLLCPELESAVETGQPAVDSTGPGP